jgi:glucose/arabinose dehydrogenase
MIKNSIIFFIFGILLGCQSIPSIGKNPVLPDPVISTTTTVNKPKLSQWQDNMPHVKEEFNINTFSKDVINPRWLYELPNGDILVAESSQNKIVLLRDINEDGVAELSTEFLSGLYSPFGMVLIGNDLYVANTDSVVKFHYESGQTSIDIKKYPPEKITDLAEGDFRSTKSIIHSTRNIISSSNKTKLYITVGATSNIGEQGLEIERGRACIWEIYLNTKQKDTVTIDNLSHFVY